MGGFINGGLLGIYVVLMEAISYSETLARSRILNGTTIHKIAVKISNHIQCLDKCRGFPESPSDYQHTMLKHTITAWLQVTSYWTLQNVYNKSSGINLPRIQSLNNIIQRIVHCSSLLYYDYWILALPCDVLITYILHVRN
jgi:hypothetical protein